MTSHSRSQGLAITSCNYRVYGFEGKGGRYLVVETNSASEARDVRDVRNASGFRTAVYDSDRELAPNELDQLADLELRFVVRR